jgi:hypothetical protein
MAHERSFVVQTPGRAHTTDARYPACVEYGCWLRVDALWLIGKIRLRRFCGLRLGCRGRKARLSPAALRDRGALVSF